MGYSNPAGLTTTSNAPGNTGGNFELYRSETEFSDGESEGSSYTSPFVQWAAWGDVSPGWYYATETGVAAPWYGVSPPSARLQVV